MRYDYMEMTSAEIVDILTKADDEYFNGNTESELSDAEYDEIKQYLQLSDRTHSYLIGVGSDVRGGKVKLPYELGSLNQSQIGEIEGWVRDNHLEHEEVIVTDKMDGTSAMIVYDVNGDLQISYSRGNGRFGADIFRSISKIKNVPQKVSGKMVVRAEVEMTEKAFAELRTKVFRSDGSQYRNARNCVAGLMNSKTMKDPIVYDYLTVIAYQIIDAPETSKINMLTRLEDEGFQITPYWRFIGKELNDTMLADYLNKRRDDTDYAIDGVVIDVNSETRRADMNPTKDTLNPEYSVKYKVADASNLVVATVKEVVWADSKHGYAKPRINIEPVELVGVTVSFCTGFNAKFIKDNGINKGVKIKITRSGDVIPHVVEVLTPAVPQLPSNIDDYEWTDTGVDLVLHNHATNDDVIINQLIDFFAKIGAPRLGKGSITKLYNANLRTPKDIIVASERTLVLHLGENGKKVFVGLKKALTNIPPHKLLGAFSNERGIGVRRMKKLELALGAQKLISGNVTNTEIARVEKFDTITAQKAMKVIFEFTSFIKSILGYYSFEIVTKVAGGVLDGKKVCFSGFRNASLGNEAEKQGATLQSGVSGATDILVTVDPNSTTGKAKKARSLGKVIMSVKDFEQLLED